MEQITDTILMIRPVSFSKNEETAINNYFQSDINNSVDTINKQAQFEFDTFVSKLKAIGVNVQVVEDTSLPVTPDAVFPNNWISFHANGDVALYPMYARNRRLERRSDVLDILENQGYFRTLKYNGKWWLVDPKGYLFWSYGVTGAGVGNFTSHKNRTFLYNNLNAIKVQYKEDASRQLNRKHAVNYYNICFYN